MTDLVATARSLFAPGKGLLAADESVTSATKRLAEYGIATSEEMRRQYRDLFINAEGIEDYLTGVILFSETLKQKGDNKQLFTKSLLDRWINPGIKVDLGTEPLAANSKELITKGLLDLSERLVEYKKTGTVFTKWRAVFTIDGQVLPSANALHENTKRLAAYAKAVQAAGLVPILEPEVLLKGKHSRAQARKTIERVMTALFDAVEDQSVDRASLVLKTSMALTGSESSGRDTPEEVAKDTVEALIATVPRQIAGIVFLSGGQASDQATENLAAVTKFARSVEAPWPLTFSYARALQDEALRAWGGKKENVPTARAAFLERLKKVSAAVA